MAPRTSASSGLTSSSRSVSVLDGAICSSGTSSPVRGQPVLGDAVMAEFEQLLAADAGQPKDFDRGERPERFLVLVGQVAPLAGDECPRPRRAARWPWARWPFAASRPVPSMT